MARTKVEIDRAVFQKIVTELETHKEFSNPSKLWEAVANTDWAKSMTPRPLTVSVLYMRAKELGIVYKTQKGKRGRAGGIPLGSRGQRVSKKDKFAKSEQMQNAFKMIRESTPERFLHIVELAANGSRSAGVKLKCLECSNYQTKEIRECNINSCGLWPFRPYQSTKEEEGDLTDGAIATAS